MAKIDLDQLEREAIASDEHCDPDGGISGRKVIALIARIRELEGTIRSFARPELLGAEVATALWRLQEKGAVLP